MPNGKEDSFTCHLPSSAGEQSRNHIKDASPDPSKQSDAKVGKPILIVHGQNKVGGVNDKS